MNLWSLDKNTHLKHLLLVLEHAFGENILLIDHGQRADQDSVYLQRPNDPTVRAYLFTHGQLDGYYGLHLEFAANEERGPILESYDRLSLQAATGSLSAHFDLRSQT